MSQTNETQMLSEIRIFPFSYAPKGWEQCNGQYLSVNTHQSLFALIGTTFGGDGRVNFQLPDLRGRVLLHHGNGYNIGKAGGERDHALTAMEMAEHKHLVVASSEVKNSDTPENNFWATDRPYASSGNTKLSENAIGMTGSNEGHDNMAPFLSLNYCIAIEGIFPSRGGSWVEDYIGTIKAMPIDFGGEEWLPCDGAELRISQYTQLYSVIGSKYGGDDRSTFKLPDLRGRATLNWGQGDGLSHYEVGETGGVAEVTLTEKQLPPHQHQPNAQKSGNLPNPTDKTVWATGAGRPAPISFANKMGKGPVMSPAALAPAGGNTAHNNMMPYQVMTYFIAWKGEFPNRG